MMPKERLTKSKARIKKYGEVFTPEWVVKKYALACSEYEDFGKLSHIVTMQYFTPELINSVILDIVK